MDFSDPFEWEERQTCFVSKHPQCTKQWFKLRKGIISGSRISKIAGRSFEIDPKEEAEIILGYKNSNFSDESKRKMNLGVKNEPKVREWFAKNVVKTEIKETGLAIWKENNLFGASPDGEFIKDGNDYGIEIKCPEDMYKGIIKKLEGDEENYIFNSHYDQMMTEGTILNKKFIFYIVHSINSGDIFYDEIEVNQDHFKEVLVPPCLEFYEKYMKPLIQSKK